jgi:hypothetical protein
MRRLALCAFLIAAPLLARTPLTGPDREAMKAFRLTVSNVTKAAAVNRRLAAEEAKGHDTGGTRRKSGDKPPTLDEASGEMESNPQASKALRAEGLKARDYLLVNLVSAQASMIVDMKQRGVEMDQAQVDQIVAPDNVAFAASHTKEMQSLTESLQLLGKNREARAGGK